MIKNYNGVINAVSNKVISFKEIANVVKNNYPGIKIIKNKRNGPMPHNGYRAFNNNLLRKIFPKIKIINLLNWIKIKDKYI